MGTKCGFTTTIFSDDESKKFLSFSAMRRFAFIHFGPMINCSVGANFFSFCCPPHTHTEPTLNKKLFSRKISNYLCDDKKCLTLETLFEIVTRTNIAQGMSERKVYATH